MNKIICPFKVNTEMLQDLMVQSLPKETALETLVKEIAPFMNNPSVWHFISLGITLAFWKLEFLQSKKFGHKKPIQRSKHDSFNKSEFSEIYWSV